MNKKQYSSPVVNKVKLVSKNAILGFCHSSPNLFPKDSLVACNGLGGCSTPPT
ncbi:MAG: hypothetical protein VB026_09805 [Anaerolineaceae bacterium]|nr:hypothetical protein [Anaerolineaceae bacterium]